VELISGTGAGPAENFLGNAGWSEFVKDYLAGKTKPSDFERIRKSENYRRCVGMFGGPSNFHLDPREYDVAHNRFNLAYALETSVSHVVYPRLCGNHATLKDDDLKKTAVCGGCGKPNVGEILKKCSKCGTSFYCGVECQAKKWPKHKTYCKALRAAKERKQY
jgi:hypothetical protein